MELVVVTDTFLKRLPDPIDRLRKLKSPGQAVLLKAGTKLEVADYFLLKNGTSHQLNDHIVIKLATPSKLEDYRNLCWFVESAHVEILNAQCQSSAGLQNRPHRSRGKRKNKPQNLELANPMDAFLGLSITPPLAVKGRHYPFGRIAYSSCSQSEREGRSPQAMSALSQFLSAQKTQLPFGLHTDWLIVNRISEIISFLPADNDKGFKVLAASPSAAKTILESLANKGLAKTLMLKGTQRADYKNLPGTYCKAETSIEELLENKDLWNANKLYQHYMNDNIQTLKEKLDLEEQHLSNIPLLFHPQLRSGRTVAYFPNMLNYRLLEDGSLLVPQPKGPIVNEKCVFETAFEYAVSPRKIRFVENVNSQHSPKQQASRRA